VKHQHWERTHCRVLRFENGQPVDVQPRTRTTSQPVDRSAGVTAATRYLATRQRRRGLRCLIGLHTWRPEAVHGGVVYGSCVRCGQTHVIEVDR
jgi:hypothetical protein